MNYIRISVLSLAILTANNLFGAASSQQGRSEPQLLAQFTPRVQDRLNRDLYDAVNRGILREVVHQIENGAELNIQKASDGSIIGAVPLLIAVDKDRLDIARVLLRHGADPNHPDILGLKMTPFHLAVEEGKLPMVKLLREAGADVLLPDEHGIDAYNKALSLARRKGSPLCAHPVYTDIANYIKPFRDMASSEKSIRELNGAVDAGDLAKVVEIRFYGDANFNTPEKKDGKIVGISPFMHAVVKDDEDIMSYFLIKGAQINAIEPSMGISPFHYAVSKNNLPLVKFLHENGGDPEVKTLRGNNALDIARLFLARDPKYAETVEYLSNSMPSRAQSSSDVESDAGQSSQPRQSALPFFLL